jgi:hypothetical protein
MANWKYKLDVSDIFYFYDWCDEDHRVWVTTRTSSLSENL